MRIRTANLIFIVLYNNFTADVAMKVITHILKNY